MNAQQSINVPIQFSADNGNTWETLVCTSDHSLEIVSAVTKTLTQCGVAVGLGAVEFNPSGSAVCNFDDTGGQVSFKDVAVWAAAQTLLKYRQQLPGTGGSIGSQFYISGFGYFSNVKKTDKVGDVETFTWAFSGIGTPSLIPGT